jgi:hypothetical protein
MRSCAARSSGWSSKGIAGQVTSQPGYFPEERFHGTFGHGAPGSTGVAESSPAS